MKLKPPFKIHGSKSNLTSFIVDHFPSNYKELNYCEPFCGAACIFLNKELSNAEVLNDNDPGVICVLKALRDEPKEFINKLKKIKTTEASFYKAQNKSRFKDYIDKAVNEFLLRSMSRGGKNKSYIEQEFHIDHLQSISKRLVNTTILNKDFSEIFRVWDEDNSLFYVDPPSLPSSNEKVNGMSVEDHINLLKLVKNARGKIILSGHSCPLYNRNLKGWKCKKKEVVNNKTECIWFNY